MLGIFATKKELFSLFFRSHFFCNVWCIATLQIDAPRGYSTRHLRIMKINLNIPSDDLSGLRARSHAIRSSYFPSLSSENTQSSTTLWEYQRFFCSASIDFSNLSSAGICALLTFTRLTRFASQTKSLSNSQLIIRCATINSINTKQIKTKNTNKNKNIKVNTHTKNID